MFLDHPSITATSAHTEPDRIERLNRIYGYVVGLADAMDNPEFIGKLMQLHDHRGTLMVLWAAAPTDVEKGLFQKAWASKLGDSSQHVEHRMQGDNA